MRLVARAQQRGHQRVPLGRGEQIAPHPLGQQPLTAVGLAQAQVALPVQQRHVLAHHPGLPVLELAIHHTHRARRLVQVDDGQQRQLVRAHWVRRDLGDDTRQRVLAVAEQVHVPRLGTELLLDSGHQALARLLEATDVRRVHTLRRGGAGRHQRQRREGQKQSFHYAPRGKRRRGGASLTPFSHVLNDFLRKLIFLLILKF
jgi:hypothetical protein